MWPFTKYFSWGRSGFFHHFTDWHCHILPGVDDGVRTMDEALAILAFYGQLGVKSVWLTPHIMEDIPNTTARLRERFDELKMAYHGNVQLHLAAENMIDNLFEERLKQDDLLPLGEDSRHLLVETSYFTPPMNLYDTLECIKAKGYHPVLAHPERYVYMNDADYNKLKGIGVKLQINLFSLNGLYGNEVKKRAERLLRENKYDLSGTDLHRLAVLKDLLNKKQPTLKNLKSIGNNSKL